MDKKFLTVVVAIVVVIVGVFIFTGKSPSQTAGTGTASNHTRGADTAAVELVEYGDFQCPACGQFYAIVKAVEEKYSDQIKFTFKHFPLVVSHQNALAASRAAEAAGLQDKFFEMYDLLYANQTAWSALTNPVPIFEDYASQLGLNVELFKTDFASQIVNDTINADLSEGKEKYSVDSTPTFILNGQKLNNTEIGSVDKFSQKIDDAILSRQASNQ